MKLAALMKKEFHRFFHDPRLIITMLIPGILIFVIYSLLGNFLQTDESQTDYSYTVYVSGESELTSLLEASPFFGDNLELIVTDDVDSARVAVEDGTATALLVFSENFDEAVAAYSPASDETAPQIEIYYRSLDAESANFYAVAASIFTAYEDTLSNKFDINAGYNFDLSDIDDVGVSVMSAILPFLVVVFIFSACMSVTLESVAGEKERGTIATILATSAKRTHIALGKVLPLSCISAIGAASSFLGVSLSLPKILGISIGEMFGGFGFVSFLLLFLLILSVVPLIVALMSVISTLSKSVKEASAYTSILMIFLMVVSLISVFVSQIGGWIVCVPVLNAVVCMQGILTMNVSVWQSLVSFAVNIVYTAVLVLLISKMFSSERIMFGS